MIEHRRQAREGRAAILTRRKALGLVWILALAGCAVGPDLQAPTHPEPPRFARAPAGVAAEGQGVQPGDAKPTQGSGTGSDASGGEHFWGGFGDPQLEALVGQALVANQDLRAALARFDSANALLREARFAQLPIVTAAGQAGQQQVSQDQSFGFARSHRSYSAGVSATWELDLVGRLRRTVEAGQSLALASAADAEALQVAVAAETASAYLGLRGWQERLRVARENAGNQTETLRVIDARLAAGRGTDFDAARARALLESTRARIPALEAQIGVLEHRIAVLTGQTPESLIAGLDVPRPLPVLPARIDPGTPADLLRRRPDIAAAEGRLQAATARIGVATADLFPRLTLLGALGGQAFQSDAVLGSSGRTSLVALGIDWSFLDVGRVRARIAASRADAADMLARYQQTVLLALEETENALINLDRTRAEDDLLKRAADESTEAARLAQVRFQAGAIDLYELLDAQRSVLAAQDSLAEVRVRSATATVALYKALAGGWPAAVPHLCNPCTGVVKPQASIGAGRRQTDVTMSTPPSPDDPRPSSTQKR